MGEGYQRIGRECESITARISRLPNSARVAIAVGAAQRLMDDQRSLPEEQQNEFVISWAPALALTWRTLLSPTPEIDRALRDLLDEYYSGPYCHELEDEALPGADEDAAAAAIYAVEAHCRQSAKSACSGALRLLTAADMRMEPFIKDRKAPETEDLRVQAEQEEIDRLNAALDILEREGVTDSSVEELRLVFGIRP